MHNSSAPWTTLLLTAALCLVLTGPSFGMQTQTQTPAAAQQNSKPAGKSEKGASTNAAPAKSKDADKLSNERMSTRGLHKQAKSDAADKPDGHSKSKPEKGSQTTPDSDR